MSVTRSSERLSCRSEKLRQQRMLNQVQHLAAGHAAIACAFHCLASKHDPLRSYCSHEGCSMMLLSRLAPVTSSPQRMWRAVMLCGIMQQSFVSAVASSTPQGQLPASLFPWCPGLGSTYMPPLGPPSILKRSKSEREPREVDLATETLTKDELEGGDLLVG